MFGYSNKALRKSVEHTLHWAEKVYNYRKDLLTQVQCRNLQQAICFDRKLLNFYL